MTVQLRVYGGLEQAGEQISKVYHLENVFPDFFDSASSDDDDTIITTIKELVGEALVQGVTGAYVKYSVIDYVGEDFLDNSCVTDGSAGIDCVARVDGATLYLSVSYEVSIPFFPDNIFTFSVTQQNVRRMWVGATSETAAEEEDADRDKVYVTKYGTVYHIYRDCRVLKRDIRTCTYSSIDDERNSQGARYTACSQCVRGSANAVVYVTSQGTRYHNSISCSTLLRYIEEVSLEETGKGLCSYCKTRQEEEQDVE